MATPTPVPVPAAPPRYNTITLDQLYALEDPEWIIERWCMRETITMISGPSESFKTFLAIDLAMTAASPSLATFQGHVVTRDRATAFGGGYKVLYVIGESLGPAKFRFQAWEQARGVTVDRNLIPVRLDRVDIFKAPGDVEALVEGHDPDIVIFDTWSRNTYGMDENSKKDVDVAMKLAHDLKKGGSRGGRSVIFIHHPTKGNEYLRGHSSMLNDSDVGIRMERPAGDKERPNAPWYAKVISERQKESDPFTAYHIRLDTWHILDSSGKPTPTKSGGLKSSLVIGDAGTHITPVPAPEGASTAGEATLPEKIEAYVRFHPGISRKEVSEAVMGTPNHSSVHRHIKKMLEDGVLTGNTKSGYTVVATEQTLEEL